MYSRLSYYRFTRTFLCEYFVFLTLYKILSTSCIPDLSQIIQGLSDDRYTRSFSNHTRSFWRHIYQDFLKSYKIFLTTCIPGLSQITQDLFDDIYTKSFSNHTKSFWRHAHWAFVTTSIPDYFLRHLYRTIFSTCIPSYCYDMHPDLSYDICIRLFLHVYQAIAMACTPDLSYDSYTRLFIKTCHVLVTLLLYLTLSLLGSLPISLSAPTLSL